MPRARGRGSIAVITGRAGRCSWKTSAAALAHHPLDEAASLARIRAWEQAWLSDGKLWPGQAPADPAAAVARVLAEADHD
jgi:hypothetical protein